jgi:hypothetical protein
MGPGGSARNDARFATIGSCYRCGVPPTWLCFPMLNGKHEIALEVRAWQFAIRRDYCGGNESIAQVERITERFFGVA